MVSECNVLPGRQRIQQVGVLKDEAQTIAAKRCKVTATQTGNLLIVNEDVACRRLVDG